ncbi:MAG TPA: sugar transferase [Candidatus Angelobacter sp.]
MNRPKKKLRVGFDARWHNESGVGRYVAELLGAMTRLGHAELVVYEDERNPLPGISACDAERVAVDGGKYSVAGQVEMAQRVLRDGLDVFHSPFYAVPLAAGCPVVVTFHDLIPFKFPIDGPVKMAMVKAGYRMAARKARQIIAVSTNTAEDVQKILGVSPGRVTVIHNAAAAVFQPQAKECEPAALRERFGVRPPYVLAASAKNWHTKNLEGALAALATAQSTARFQTVIYGPQDGIRAAGGSERWGSLEMRIIGPVEAGELAALFRQARAYIVPSLYEGFGLPVVEAMACGCPVVTSTGGSLAEVAGEGAQAFPPGDVAGMAAAVAKLVTDEEENRKWQAAALRRAADFSWEKAARATTDVYYRAYCPPCQTKTASGVDRGVETNRAKVLQEAVERPARVMPMTAAERFAKRAGDIVGASIALLLCWPVIALLGLLVKLQDGGPVLHRRRVVGPKGEFDAFKLRSMRVDADQVLTGNPALQREFERNFKLKDDPRVTSLGRFLRRTSLDELPQLWNVLKGEMSMVGPRMISPAELAKYGDAAWIFHCVRPGLTGYWQIYGRQAVSYRRRVEMDLYYVQNWSPAMDLALLLKTPMRVLRGAGGY